ncbi:SH3 domain-containing protein [Aeromicrobium sp.]
MAVTRHKHARTKHSLSKPWYQRALRLALPAGGVLAVLVASLAVAFSSPESIDASATASVGASTQLAGAGLASTTSRDDVRPPLPDEVETETKFATEDLDLHAGPAGDSPVLTEIKAGTKVQVTGEVDGKWAEIIHKGTSRSVTAKFVKSKMPEKPDKKKPAAGGISGAPCASGSGPESGLQPDTIRVHRAVCKLFPVITSYGGTGGGGEHAAGRALDIMTRAQGTGDAIAAYLQKNARALGVTEVIWQQRIWTTQRSGGGWRPMSDRGSPTANHMDHVHVTTSGNAGTS